MRLAPASLLACALASAGAAGCAFDGEVSTSSKARIACKRAEDCPPDWQCRDALQRCVPANLVDGKPPLFAAPATVTPRFANAGAPVTVTFSSTEALGDPPRVTLVDAAATHVMTSTNATGAASSASSATGPFGFAFTPTGHEPEGDAAILVDLVDPGGDASFGLLAGVVTLDFTAPQLVDATVTLAPPPSSLGASTTQLVAGGTLRVSLRVDDVTAAATASLVPHAGSSSSAAAGTIELAASPSAGADQRAFALVDGGDLAAGDYDLVATLTDPAGNATTGTVAPVVVAAFVPSPCPAVDASGAFACTDDDGDGHFGISSSCPAGDDCNDDDPLTHPGALDVPGDGFDNTCSGAGDGVVDESIGMFAAPNGSSSAPGTRAAPLDGLASAVIAARAAGKAWVFLAGGAYVETANVDATGVDIAGGFDASTWTRSAGAARTAIKFPTQASCAAGIRVTLAGASFVLDGIDLVDDCQGGTVVDVAGGFGGVRDVTATSAGDPLDTEVGSSTVVARSHLSSTAGATALFAEGDVVVVRSQLDCATADALDCSGADCTVLQSVLHGSFHPHADAIVHVLSSSIVSAQNTTNVADSFTLDMTSTTVVVANGNSLFAFSASAPESNIAIIDSVFATGGSGAFFFFTGSAQHIDLTSVDYDTCLIQDSTTGCLGDNATTSCEFPSCNSAIDVNAVGPLSLDVDGRAPAGSPLAASGASLAGSSSSLAVDPDGTCRDLAEPGLGAFVVPAP